MTVSHEDRVRNGRVRPLIKASRYRVRAVDHTGAIVKVRSYLRHTFAEAEADARRVTMAIGGVDVRVVHVYVEEEGKP